MQKIIMFNLTIKFSNFLFSQFLKFNKKVGASLAYLKPRYTVALVFTRDAQRFAEYKLQILPLVNAI